MTSLMIHWNQLRQICVSANVGLPLQHKFIPKWGPYVDERSASKKKIVRKLHRILQGRLGTIAHITLLTLHYIALHCITLHYTTLINIILLYITLLYITQILYFVWPWLEYIKSHCFNTGWDGPFYICAAVLHKELTIVLGSNAGPFEHSTHSATETPLESNKKSKIMGLLFFIKQGSYQCFGFMFDNRKQNRDFLITLDK